LEHFGYKFSTDNGKLKKEIDESGVCFLHAPLFNPAMKNVAPVRRALKIKTFFNMLGPMVNPSFPAKQLIGVYSLELARLYNYLYQQSAIKYMIIFSLDGYDEVSLTSEFKYILNGVEHIVSPEMMNYKRALESELIGGRNVPEAGDLFMKILKGEGTTTQNNVITVNAQMALKCYYPSKSFEECREIASESLISRKAFKSFIKLVELQS
jgi:anthranilate phosphoribosyltransferase